MKPKVNLRRELISEIRDLARQLRDAYAIMPQPSDPARDGEIGRRMSEYFSDPVRIQLEKMIGDLPKDDRVELAALVDLGTLGRSVKDWDWLLQNARQTDGEGTARNLVGRRALAYLIDQGMAKLQAAKYIGRLDFSSLPSNIESKTEPLSLMQRAMKAIRIGIGDPSKA